MPTITVVPKAKKVVDLGGYLKRISSLERLFNKVSRWANYKPSNFFSRGQGQFLKKGLQVTRNLAGKADKRAIAAGRQAGQAWNASREQRKLFQSLQNGLTNVQSRVRDVDTYTRNKYTQLLYSNKALKNKVNGVGKIANKANSLANRLAPLLAIVGLVASIASLVVSIGTLKTLGNRIDQVEKGLILQGNEISRLYTIITPLINKLRSINPIDAARLTAQLNSLNTRLSTQINNVNRDLGFTRDTLKALGNQVAFLTGSYIGGVAISAVLGRFPWIRNGGNQQVINNYTTNNYVTNNNANIDYGRIENIARRNSGNIDYKRIDRLQRKNNAPLSLQNSSIKKDTNFIRKEMKDISSGFAAITDTIKDQVGRTNSFIRKQLKPISENVTNIKKRTQSLYDNQFVQTALNALNTAFLVHNAGRLSIDATLFVGDVLDQLLGYAGINFKDTEGSDITLNQAIGSKVNGMIDAVVPATFQNNLSEIYLKSSTIFRSGANIFWAMESMKDEVLNVTEIANDRLGLWMNTAREERVVSFDAYPHQPPISTKSRYGRVNSFLEKVNRGTEGWTNTIDGVENGVSTVSYVASVPISINDELSFVGEERQRISDAVGGEQATQAQADIETLLNNEAPEILNSTQDYLPDEVE